MKSSRRLVLYAILTYVALLGGGGGNNHNGGDRTAKVGRDQ